MWWNERQLLGMKSGRDAGSMALRCSVSFSSGNHGYIHNLGRSRSGTRAASKNAMGTRMPASPCLVCIQGAQLRQENRRIEEMGVARRSKS